MWFLQWSLLQSHSGLFSLSATDCLKLPPLASLLNAAALKGCESNIIPPGSDTHQNSSKLTSMDPTVNVSSCFSATPIPYTGFSHSKLMGISQRIVHFVSQKIVPWNISMTCSDNSILTWNVPFLLPSCNHTTKVRRNTSVNNRSHRDDFCYFFWELVILLCKSYFRKWKYENKFRETVLFL